MNDSPLVVNELNKYYRSRRGIFHAARGVTFEIQDGEFYTLLGPSGCGKSTTLRCVAGLERIDSGEIRVGSRTVSSGQRSVFVPPNRREIGMVFQNYGIWPHMNVFDNVAFPLQVSKGVRVSRAEIRSRTEEALNAVQLYDVADRRGTELSGGQQQRVALARALVSRPRLLLLDEPLSNLDATLRESMRSEVRRLQKSLGVTTLFVTHDQTEALSMSDRVAVMKDGKIVQEGGPRDIYLKPSNQYVAGFLGRINKFLVDVVGADGAGLTLRFGDIPIRILADLSTDDVSREGNGAAVLAVRPENMRIANSDDAGGSTNRLRGRVTGLSFLGDAIDYQIDIRGTTIIVNQHPDAQISLGADVDVLFRPEHGLLFPAAASDSADPVAEEASSVTVGG